MVWFHNFILLIRDYIFGHKSFLFYNPQNRFNLPILKTYSFETLFQWWVGGNLSKSDIFYIGFPPFFQLKYPIQNIIQVPKKITMNEMRSD